MRSALLVGLYLAAIVAANLIISHFGPEASIVTAAAMIGLVLTTRDRLHDLWAGHRVRNMALLIGAGSVLSYVAATTLLDAPPDVIAQIALGSCVAFAVAESSDALLYHAIRRKPWLERVNTSNLLSASLDSTVFVWIAFGFDWQIVVAQTGAKVLGGYVYSLIIRYTGRIPEREPVPA